MTVPEPEPEPSGSAEASPAKPSTAAPSMAAATKNFIRDLMPLTLIEASPF
jgi:hypothetical protein